MLKYEGGRYFRQKIICATLAGKSVKLSNIRLEEENVGLAGTSPPPACSLPTWPKVEATTRYFYFIF
jgi:hypothetical protein